MTTRRLLPALLLAAALAAATPVGATPPIWRVHGPNGGELTLFGSVHLLSDRTDWREPALSTALAHADELLFEIPMDAAAQSDAQAQAIRAGMLPPGRTLSAMLPPDTRSRLARVLARLGVGNPHQLDGLKPWLADVTVSLLYFQSRGASGEQGVEKSLDAGTPPRVRRGALETVRDQIAALAGDTEADQVQSLSETLREIEDKPDSYDRLANAWAAGDLKTIQVEGLDDLRRHAPGAYRRLIVVRNRRWAPELEALLKGREHAVVVVGVGHLIGPDGVPALLRRDGYTVEGP